MRDSRNFAAGVIAAVVIATLAFAVGPPKLGWVPTIASLAVLVMVLAFDPRPARSFAQSFAYAAACGFLLATAAIYPLMLMLPQLAASPNDAIAAKPWIPAITLLGIIAFLSVDRMRSNSRPVVVELATASRVPLPEPRAEQPSVQEPKRQELRPEAREQVRQEPVPAPRPVAQPVIQPIAQPVAQPIGQPVQAQPVPAGRPATIYLNLTDAGITCLRAVKAEYLAKDFYRIVEPTPPGETWEFQTGQIVRCKKKTLSSGKAMVAFEEAQRVS